MALIELAQADPALAVKVRQEEAASPAEKKAWSALWDRLSPVTTVIGGLALVAVGMHAGAHEALLTALSPLVITDPLYIMRNGRWGHTAPQPAAVAPARPRQALPG
ncbi:DUF3693 domain-containing protein [Xanthomonas citri]|uniref:DUF3693 domain-containing protein n=1 Tax=Xanthomonas citri TaxID=346 RepID=UPI001CBA751F|nr:DUF3693 domain-containing protein [Xanthomonas citri]